MKEYNEIVGERPSPLNSDLERECEKYEEAHHVSFFWIRSIEPLSFMIKDNFLVALLIF